MGFRTETLNEACLELQESGLDQKNPTIIHCHDLSILSLSKSIDFIWAFSVLIHLSDHSLDEMLAFSARSLSPTGKLLANVHNGNQPDRHWRNFPVVSRSPEFYRQAFAKHGLRVADIGSLRDYGHVARPKSEAEELLQRILEAHPS